MSKESRRRATVGELKEARIVLEHRQQLLLRQSGSLLYVERARGEGKYK